MMVQLYLMGKECLRTLLKYEFRDALRKKDMTICSKFSFIPEISMNGTTIIFSIENVTL